MLPVLAALLPGSVGLAELLLIAAAIPRHGVVAVAAQERVRALAPRQRVVAGPAVDRQGDAEAALAALPPARTWPARTPVTVT